MLSLKIIIICLVIRIKTQNVQDNWRAKQVFIYYHTIRIQKELPDCHGTLLSPRFVLTGKWDSNFKLFKHLIYIYN